MRTAARFTISQSNGDLDELFEKASSHLERWFQRKFLENKTNRIDLAVENIGSRLFMRTEETVNLTRFCTETVLQRRDALLLQCELTVGSAQGNVVTPSFSVHPPTFISYIVALQDGWRFQTRADTVSPKVFSVTLEEYTSFIEFLQNRERRLPIICVARGSSVGERERLAATLGRRGAGLAHTVLLDEKAGWRLSVEVGKQWSCFDGGVRLYWPGEIGTGNPFKHPLTLGRRIDSFFASGDYAVERLADVILNPILEASTYNPVFAEIRQFDDDLLKSQFEDQLSELKADNDLATALQSAEARNALLEQDVAVLRLNLQTAHENLRLLYQSQTPTSMEDGSELSAGYETWKGLVRYVEKKYSGKLIFNDNIDTQLSSLAELPALQEKVEAIFEKLSELQIVLLQNGGSIGDTLVKWLLARGVDCSGESETVKGKGLLAANFDGKADDFELHAKPNEGTAPNKCIRIYFKPSTDYRAMKIGYFGSKKGL